MQHRLEERSAEVEKLKQDLKRVEGELAIAQAAPHGKAAAAQNNTSGSPPATISKSPPGAAVGTARGGDNPADPPMSEPSYFMTPPDEPARPAWHWALGSFVIALALGFALGWYALDRRIRRKYGGLRIY